MHITVIGFGPVEKNIIKILDNGGIAGYSVVAPENTYKFPHYHSMDDFRRANKDNFEYASKNGNQRICIDFSCGQAVKSNLAFYAENKLNAVIGTDGVGLDEIDVINIQNMIQESGITVIFSSNFSITEQMFIAANKIMAAVGAGNDVDVMLNEKFNGYTGKISSFGRKLTSDIIKTPYFGKKGFYLHPKKVNDKTSIPVHSCNSYHPLPEHTIEYQKENNKVELIHTGTTPDVVAMGAIDAAKRINVLKPGFYDYSQLILNDAVRKLKTK